MFSGTHVERYQAIAAFYPGREGPMRSWKLWKRADAYRDCTLETGNSNAAYLFFQTRPNELDENCHCKKPQKSNFQSRTREALRRAVKSLEHPSLAGRLTNLVGKPVELIGYALPSFASKAIASATSKGLEAALKVALRTLRSSPRTNSQFLHRTLATASGAAGGTFGLAALPVELPVSTIIMLRSIADIARSEGEDLSDPETALSCVEVFALGGRVGSADVSESGYFAVRGVLRRRR